MGAYGHPQILLLSVNPLIIQIFQFFKYYIIQYLDIGSLHTGGSGFDYSGTFKLTQGVDNYGSGNPDTVCDLTCYQNSFIALKFIKDMGNSFQF